MLSTPLAGCLDSISSGDGIFEEPEPLRINHIQVLGTHNSYHIKPFGPAISAIGILAKRPPKPIGSSSKGSKFFAIAR